MAVIPRESLGSAHGPMVQRQGIWDLVWSHLGLV